MSGQKTIKDELLRAKNYLPQWSPPQGGGTNLLVEHDPVGSVISAMEPAAERQEDGKVG